MMKSVFYCTFFVLFGLSLHAQNDPCLRVLPELSCPSTAAVVTPTTNVASFRHDNKRRGLSATDSARYKAFWIMGDGNFIQFNDYTAPSDDERSLDIDYNYQRSNNYIVVPVLVEKKSNGQPPGTDYRQVSIQMNRNAVVPPSVRSDGGAFNTTLRGAQRANITPSSKVRLGGYPTAFATSAPMNAEGRRVMMFFYNSMRLDSTKSFNPEQLFIPETSDALAPAYMEKGVAPQWGVSSNAGSSIARAANSSGYKNIVAIDIQVNPELVTSGFNEFRFFPLLRTTAATGGTFRTGIPGLDSLGRGEAQFLTLVLENASINPQYDSSNVESQMISSGQNATPPDLPDSIRLNILAILKAHFKDLLIGLDTNSLRLPNGMYIRGVAYNSTEIVSSVDPTALDVLQICPTGEGKFQVDMKISICNEGNMEEPLVTAEIYNTKNIQILNPTFDSTDLDGFRYNVSGAPTWAFDYKRGLPGVYETGAFKSHCISREFSFTTDWAGVKVLRDGKALTAKIHFHSALVMPVQYFDNPAFPDSSAVSEQCGYKCPTANCEKTDCVWLYCLLFVLLLLLWWYWKNKQDD